MWAALVPSKARWETHSAGRMLWLDWLRVFRGAGAMRRSSGGELEPWEQRLEPPTAGLDSSAVGSRRPRYSRFKYGNHSGNRGRCAYSKSFSMNELHKL